MAGCRCGETITGMKLWIALAAAVVAMTGCSLDAPEEHSARTFTHAGGKLTIRSGLGGLRITQGSASQVVVNRWLRGKAADESSWKLENGTLTLNATCRLVFGDCGARYQVTVPPGVELEVDGGDDGVIVSGLAQPVAVATSGGRIQVSDLSGRLRLRTWDGAIHAERLRSPDVRARSGDGEILLSFATAPTTVDAVSREGRVVARVPDGVYSVTAKSTYGSEKSAIKDAGRDSARTIVAKSTEGDVSVIR